MSLSFAESTQLFDALPEAAQQYFYGIASKSNGEYSAQEFFHSEVPDIVKDDPEGLRLLLDGGTIESGGATYSMPDRDMSRVESGANGGEYTPDNVVLEDASINRARGADDMTASEFTDATESLSADADLIAERVAEDAGEIIPAVAEGADGVFETVLEGILPVTVGIKAAHSAWQSTENLDDGERAAVAALAGGSGVLATVAVVSNPIGAACVAAYGTWKLFELGAKLFSND